jgi:hypothetical protein
VEACAGAMRGWAGLATMQGAGRGCGGRAAYGAWWWERAGGGGCVRVGAWAGVWPAEAVGGAGREDTAQVGLDARRSWAEASWAVGCRRSWAGWELEAARGMVSRSWANCCERRASSGSELGGEADAGEGEREASVRGSSGAWCDDGQCAEGRLLSDRSFARNSARAVRRVWRKLK